MDPKNNPFSILEHNEKDTNPSDSKLNEHPPEKHRSADSEASHITDTDKPPHTPTDFTVSSSSFFTTAFEQSIGIKPEIDPDKDTEWVTVNAAEHGREVLDPTKYPGGLLYCIQALGYDDAMPDLQEKHTAETFASIFQSFLDTHCPVMRIVSTCVMQTDLTAKKVFLFVLSSSWHS
eukprot:844107-Ditylum_brightwellii.AAC.2